MNTIPDGPQLPSSQPVFRRLLRLSFVATLILAAAAYGAGALWGGSLAPHSALLGALLGGGLMMLTGVSIVLANRKIASPLYVQIFFAALLGTLLLKMIVFIFAVVVLKDAAWIDSKALFVALLSGVIVSLAFDLLVILRSRMPAASEVKLHE